MPRYLKCQIVFSFLQENLKTQSFPFSQANGKSFRFFLVFRIAVPLGVQHHKRKKSSERLCSKLFHWKNGQAPYYVTNEPHSLQEIPGRDSSLNVQNDISLAPMLLEQAKHQHDPATNGKHSRTTVMQSYFCREHGPFTQPPGQHMTSRKLAGILPAAYSFSIASVFLSMPLIDFASSLKVSVKPPASWMTASVTPQLRAKFFAVAIAGRGIFHGSQLMTSIFLPASIPPSSSKLKT